MRGRLAATAAMIAGAALSAAEPPASAPAPSAMTAAPLGTAPADVASVKQKAETSELREGRAVHSRIYFARECALPQSSNSQRIVISDGKLGRIAKAITLRISYPGTGMAPKQLSCASANLCANSDNYGGTCRSACVEGSWETADGRTVAIPRACENE